ncbi:MAG: hypothetical protein ACPGJV_16285 [Bacteriovoracaceae bacterium]
MKDIKFNKNFKVEDHSAFQKFKLVFQSENPEFITFHEIFERLVCEVSIIRGECTNLEMVAIKPEEKETSLFEYLIGVNYHSEKRTKMLEELLKTCENESESDYLNPQKYMKLEYCLFYFDHTLRNAGNLSKRLPHFIRVQKAHKSIQKQLKRIRTMFFSLKNAESLVGHADQEGGDKTLNYYDIPWAIRYGEVIKRRDGAHRRAIMKYLGHEKIPTLVCDYKEVTQKAKSFVNNSFILNNIDWYSQILDQNYLSSFGHALEKRKDSHH